MGSSKLQSNESEENSILSRNQLDKTSIKPQNEPKKNLIKYSKHEIFFLENSSSVENIEF
ncbi:hypothetical protein P5673_016819 [Acropora cervicornis]|uniref:Uncharacterized protein n=1 Tax=Acropora cervicornis TaxID=6130 RepID=A0AAD9QGE0_ACRCE|nr:hypothetical protein P5673_016819 [Acropora cervicornis]